MNGIVNHIILTGLVCVVLGSIVVVGCGGDEDGTPDLSKDLQEITLRLDQMPATLDPTLASFTGDLALGNQLFRGLLWYNQDLELVPMVAEEVPTEGNGGISSDGLVYTFKLHEDARWSNGQPVTAHDFDYSLKRLLDPRTGAPFASSWFNITGAEKFATASPAEEAEVLEKLRSEVGVKAIDDRTLVITLNGPQAGFLHELVTMAAMPVPREVVEQFAENWTAPQNFVGNGPFVLGESSGESFVLNRNPHWWKHGPYLETVTFVVIQDPAKAFSEYLAGNIDYISLPPAPDVLAVVDGDPELKRESNTLTRLTSVALVFNNTRAPFDEELVRKAFASALDREALIDRFQPGAVKVSYSWIPDGMPGYDDKLGTESHHDAEKARDLLSEAGYPGGSGLPQVLFAYPESQAALALAVQEQVEQSLGVRIELLLVDPEESRRRFLSGDYQIVSSGWTATVPDPGSVLADPFGCQRYEGTSCAQFANTNRAYYANPEFDRLIAQANKELDEDRRLDLYIEAHEMMVEDVPAIFLGTLIRRYMVKPYVKEFLAVPIDQEFPGSYFLEKTYIQGRDERD